MLHLWISCTVDRSQEYLSRQPFQQWTGDHRRSLPTSASQCLPCRLLNFQRCIPAAWQRQRWQKRALEWVPPKVEDYSASGVLLEEEPAVVGRARHFQRRRGRWWETSWDGTDLRTAGEGWSTTGRGWCSEREPLVVLGGRAFLAGLKFSLSSRDASVGFFVDLLLCAARDWDDSWLERVKGSPSFLDSSVGEMRPKLAIGSLERPWLEVIVLHHLTEERRIKITDKDQVRLGQWLWEYKLLTMNSKHKAVTILSFLRTTCFVP